VVGIVPGVEARLVVGIVPGVGAWIVVGIVTGVEARIAIGVGKDVVVAKYQIDTTADIPIPITITVNVVIISALVESAMIWIINHVMMYLRRQKPKLFRLARHSLMIPSEPQQRRRSS